MTPTRSLAASLVALGLASAFTAPLPAFAASAPCARAENYAAQSGAETLRINRLDLRTEQLQRPSIKPSKPDSVREDGTATNRLSKPSSPSPSATPSADSDDPSPSASASADDDNGDDPGDDTDGTGGSGAGEVIGEVGNVTKGDTASGSADKSDEDATTSSSGAAEGASSGKSASLQDVGVGQARTALTADAQVNSAAVARMLDGQASGSGALSRPLVQQAPPGHDQPATRATPAGHAGPLRFGGGELSSLARWDAGMACGATTGNVSRSTSSLSRVDVLPGEDGALVGVPGTLSSESTTALDRPSEAPRTVASATVVSGRMTLAGGRVRLTLLQPPVLTASMTAGDGGQISYRPAVVEVSGPGIVSKRLSTAGDAVNISLGDDDQQSESAPADSSSAWDGGVQPGARLPLPEIAGLPSIQAPSLESAPVSGSGTRIRVALGRVRQAKKGHAIAARVNAVTIAITQGSANHGDDSQSKDDGYGRDSRTKQGYGSGCRCKQTDCQCEQQVTAEVTVGALEAAAAAPGSPATTAPAPVAGAALPVTGPEAESVALGGVGLLVAGTAALFVGRRRRRPTP